MRKLILQSDYFYHIYNRGVDKREVFSDEKDYLRFLKSLREFNQLETIESLYRQDQLKRKEAKPLRFSGLQSKPENRSGLASLVEIVCYCLNPNHYHLLLKQLSEKGIENFMHKLSTGYTRYFNDRYHRSGSLFQGTYKAIEIKSDGYLNQLSCYINGNAEIHKIVKAEKWPWSSYLDYLGKRKGTLINKGIILNEFKDINEYKLLTETVIKESSERKEEIKKYLME